MKKKYESEKVKSSLKHWRERPDVPLKKIEKKNIEKLSRPKKIGRGGRVRTQVSGVAVPPGAADEFVGRGQNILLRRRLRRARGHNILSG